MPQAHFPALQNEVFYLSQQNGEPRPQVASSSPFLSINRNLVGIRYLLTNVSQAATATQLKKGITIINDTFSGSTSSSSFAVSSLNTVGNVASISATSLTTGNGLILQSASCRDCGNIYRNIIDAKDTSGRGPVHSYWKRPARAWQYHSFQGSVLLKRYFWQDQLLRAHLQSYQQYDW